MRRNFASSTSGRNARSSCAPACTKRKPVWEKRALPPDSSSGAFSSITTEEAPAARAAIAASKAALPPPITMMSQVVVVGGMGDGVTHTKFGRLIELILAFVAAGPAKFSLTRDAQCSYFVLNPRSPQSACDRSTGPGDIGARLPRRRPAAAPFDK